MARLSDVALFRTAQAPWSYSRELAAKSDEDELRIATSQPCGLGCLRGSQTAGRKGNVDKHEA